MSIICEEKKIVDARNLICCTSNKTALKKVHFYNYTRDSFGMKKKSFRNCQQFHVFGKFWWSLNIIWIFKQPSRTSKPQSRGVLGVLEKFVWGGYLGLQGSPFSCFIAFLWPNFSDLTPPPPTPQCASMLKTIQQFRTLYVRPLDFQFGLIDKWI